MSIFGGSMRVGSDKPQYTGLQVQTSSQSISLPIIFGKNRVAPNMLWYGDFKPIKHVTKTGGKGGIFSPSVKNISWTYSASFIFAICEGADGLSIDRAWRDRETVVDFASFGFTLFEGDVPQEPWGYLTSAHPTEALGYPGVAYVAVANYDLGESPNIPSHTFEVEAILFNTQVDGNGDADPALMIEAIFTSEQYGCGFPPTSINEDTLFSGPNATTTGDSAYQTYCRAMGFGLSPALSDPEATSEIISRWCKLTNTATFWSGAQLKFVPYGDEEITAHGVTYLPPTEIRANLSDADYVYDEGTSPVRIIRSDPADAFNLTRLEVKDRASGYNLVPVEYKDQAQIEALGLRPSPKIKAHEVCVLEMGKVMVDLIGKRKLYIRNTYEFTLSWEFCRLEAMDVVTLTSPRLNLAALPVRITEVEEDEEGMLHFTAEEFMTGLSSTTAVPTQNNEQTPPNTGVAPGPVNAPIFFEPPGSELTNGLNELWVFLSGDNSNWGGAYVWVSQDGTSYTQIGQVNAPARQGVLTAGLADYMGANPDTMNTLSVDLTMSDGELSSVSAMEAADGIATLCLVGASELLSYEVATLTDPNEYDLDNLYRGLYGTSRSSHMSAASFVRVDGTQFRYQLPTQYVGTLLYFKFTSFNAFGQALEALDDATEYTYTPDGGGVPAPPTNLSATDGNGFIQLDWDASPTAGISGYVVYAVNNHTGTFMDASPIFTVGPGVTSWTHSGLMPGDLWRYWVVAYNASGESEEEGPADGTVLSRATQTYFDTGTPDPMIGEDGDLYFDTTMSPFIEYVKYMGAWEIVD